MAKTTLQLRRGTQSENSSFTGAQGEVTVDTTRSLLVVHDGTTVGGNALAPLSNPAFTGTPTAPTPGTSDNTTKIATTAYVKANIAALAAPSLTTTDVTEGTRLYFTKDRVNTALTAGTNVSITQPGGSGSNTVINVTLPTNVSSFANDVGYLTSASIRTEISATGSINYDSGTGIISYTQAVDSVNAKTGVVVLNSDDISDVGRTNKWASASVVRGHLSSGTGIGFASGVISLANTSITLNSKSISLTSGASQTVTTDDITEGSTNKYASATNVRSQLSAGTGVTFVSGVISIGQAIGTASSPSFAGLSVTGDVTIDSNTFKLDSTLNRVGIITPTPQYELDVTGDVNLTGRLRLSGDAGTTGFILQSAGSGASPVWANISASLPNITELDPFVQDGGTHTFSPTNNGNPVTITAPIQALIIRNGITLKPYINYADTFWNSYVKYGDYTLDSLGRIVFSSVPQPTDSITVRVLVGNTANTINTTYPYRAIDIMTGY
jgi:hypothetical protein